MPVNVKLNFDETYLIYELEDPLTVQQLLAAYEKEKQFRDATQRQLHSMVDLSMVRSIPRNWLTTKVGPGFTHPRSGRILLVGTSVGIRIIVETILKIVRYKKVQFFDTRQEAEAHIAALLEKPASTELTDSDGKSS
jgi:hypothetical protein